MPFTPVPIIEEVLLTILPRLDVADDNLENALDIEFVAEFTFPPALANFASASVMRMVFSLILGAVFITSKKDNTSFASVPSWLDVCPILFPELANCAID